jgi:hypothetical protein
MLTTLAQDEVTHGTQKYVGVRRNLHDKDLVIDWETLASTEWFCQENIAFIQDRDAKKDAYWAARHPFEFVTRMTIRFETVTPLGDYEESKP